MSEAMRLIDFKPHWIQPGQWTANVQFYIGVSFLCPHCTHGSCPTCGNMRGQRIAVNFWPPIDPEAWESRITEIPHAKFHQRTRGETFETLTITPGVRIEGHWAGVIKNGELFDALARS